MWKRIKRNPVVSAAVSVALAAAVVFAAVVPWIIAQHERENARLLEIERSKADAEKEFSTDAQAEERVLKYKNEAIAAYQTVIMLTDPNQEGVGPHLEDAYNQCLPIMLETARDAERATQIIEDCDAYISQYPDGKYIVDIQRYKSQGKIKLTQFAAAPAPPTDTTPETENK